MGNRKTDNEIKERCRPDAIDTRKRDGGSQPTADPPTSDEQQNEAKIVKEKPPEQPKEVPKRRKQSADYGSTYLQKNEIKTRQCVYISREVHTKISKIVKVIADSEITVGGYIDSVLAQHLEQHKDEINEMYRKQREDLI